MNPWALLPLSGFVACLALGLFVFYTNPTRRLNKVYFAAAMLQAVWAFAHFGMTQAESYDSACFWAYAYFPWTLAVAVFFHFVLVFTEQEHLLKRPFLAFTLYPFALFWTGTALVWPALSLGYPKRVAWGWSYEVPNHWLYYGSDLWALVFSVTPIVMGFRYLARQTDVRKRKQAWFVSAGYTVSLVAGLTTEMFLPVMGVDVPELTSVSLTVALSMVGYAVWRYDLFRFNPATAAESILRTMSDALLLVAPTGEALTANRAFYETTKLDESQVIEKPIDDMLQLEHAGPHRSFFSLLHSKANVQETDALCATRNGITIPMAVTASTMFDHRGTAMGVVVIGRDVREKRQAELRLLEAEERLTQAEKESALARLLAQLSHHINNPINVVVNNIAPLKQYLDDMAKLIDAYKNQESQLPDGGRELAAMREKLSIDFVLSDFATGLDTIESAAWQVLALQAELKAFRAADSGFIGPGDINAEIRSILLALAPTLPAGVSIEEHLGQLPEMLFNGHQLQRVFTSLLKNSLAEVGDAGRIVVTTRLLDSGVEVAIADTGPGIAVELQDKIFEPFFSTKSFSRGRGLSLAISRQVVVQHLSGTLELDKAYNSGARFVIRLPMTPPSAEI